METLKAHKLFQYENSKGEQRIGLTLKADYGIFALSKMGSVTLSKAVTVEQAEKEFGLKVGEKGDGNVVPQLKFGNKEIDMNGVETGFYEVVPA